MIYLNARRLLLTLVCCGVFSGCASALVTPEDRNDWLAADPGLVVGPGLSVFNMQTGPLSQRLGVAPKSVGSQKKVEKVSGKACQHGVSLPLFIFNTKSRIRALSAGFGDGGYMEAMKALRAENPGLEEIYDVKVDMDHLIVLSVYYRNCVVVTANGVFKKA